MLLLKEERVCVLHDDIVWVRTRDLMLCRQKRFVYTLRRRCSQCASKEVCKIHNSHSVHGVIGSEAAHAFRLIEPRVLGTRWGVVCDYDLLVV